MSSSEPSPGQEAYWSHLASVHGDSSETEASSRLSKTNRADPQKRREKASAPESRKLPLTDRDGVTLRSEVRDLRDVHHDSSVSWSAAVDRWREYIDERRDVAAVFENSDTGEQVRGSDPHRFAPEYADKQYAKLKDLERGLLEDYGKRLHTAMLTFTASAAPDGEQLPPVDHLDGLLSSWDAIRRTLDRQLQGRRYERLAILEPHPGDGVNNGYLHVHMAVFVDGVVTRDDLAPVIQAHVRNCDLAQPDAHDLDDETTISVRHAGSDREDSDDALDELAIYLAEYLGTYGDDPLEQAEHLQAANTVLWATGRQRWRPSNGAQQYMAAPDSGDESSAWELVGIDDGDELIPASGESGGVSTFTTGSVGYDPPP